MPVPTEREITFAELDEAKKYAKVIPVGELNKEKIVIFSDHHKGSGHKKVDLFQQNEDLYYNVLKKYLANNFTLVIAGDAEENWGFSLESIFERYDNIFELEKEFALRGKYYRLYGNHDTAWEPRIDREREMLIDSDETRRYLTPRYGEKLVYPAVILKGGKRDIFIVHGHQGDPKAHQGEGVSRGIVYFFTHVFFKLFGRKNKKINHHAEKLKYRDQLLYEWAEKEKVLLLAGHTHRLLFKCYENNGKTPYYFNAGACKFKDGITSLEISDGRMKLLQWKNKDVEGRETVYGTRELGEIFDSIEKNENDGDGG